MRKSRAKRPLPTIPSNTYVDFSQLLREQLLADPSRKAGYLSEVFESKLIDGGASAPPDVRRDRAIDKWLGREVVNRTPTVGSCSQTRRISSSSTHRASR